MSNIAIFASGSGTNAENIINYFSKRDDIVIQLVLSNKKDAFVLKRAEDHHIPTYTFNRETFYNTQQVLYQLQQHNIDFVVLAGFLWLVPDYITNAYPNHIINIHPALLPKYGGKGMYGHHVHEAVINAGEKFSGITIHYVNSAYDSGDIIFQATCEIAPGETPESLAEKVHELEYRHFPEVIDNLITGKDK
ncbi:MAG TPA: phosphoribosylglycinamide formyltransferase [Bacteroidales bacterium]|nr:phosphoribosylglycinamide formyltransferase [Bacteroidales bacterium]